MPRRPRGGVEVQVYSFFNLGARWVGVQRHVHAALPPRERPGTHCIGGWLRPRAGLDGFREISSPPEFDPRIFRPVASRYTD